MLWLAVLFFSCFRGAYPLEMTQVLKALGAKLNLCAAPPSLTELLVLEIRLPRIILAALCGGSLAMAGVCLQGTLKNRLADPFTLGLAAGAACGASLVLSDNLGIANHLPNLAQASLISLMAFLGALLATSATLYLGQNQGHLDRSQIILAGIAVATFLGALVALVKALNEESVTSIVFWIMGSFQGKTWQELPLLLLTLIPSLIFLAFNWRALDLFSLGDDAAQQLGLNVVRLRLGMILVASLMTAGCVATAGVIGFVGLVVPHIFRLLLGLAHGPLLLASFLGGGMLLVLADLLARSAFSDGQEIPVGVVTALMGGPFFAYLIRKRHA
ncbi:MAG: iron ABC transporter permease [Desulfovibrionaceae bacterium]|nr:iron ABC transporter permease [Desulfovibrionaceae bacterium]